MNEMERVAQDIITRAQNAASAVEKKLATQTSIIDNIDAACKETMKSLDAVREETKGIVAEAEKQTEAMVTEIANWEEEKKRIASTHNVEPTIKLDIGGQSFTTTITTLTRFPDTMLGAMFSGRHALTKNEAGAHFIDRSGRHFHEILDFLRCPEAWDNSGIQGRHLTELKMEAEYYGLKDLMFPPAPPVPLVTPWSKNIDVSQDNDQLWYIQSVELGPTPLIVQLCDHCGFGWPLGQVFNYGVQQFRTGRTITATQPRKTGTCPLCFQ